MASKQQADAAQPDASTLVPRIKTLQFTAALRAMNIPEDQLPYTEPLVADLLVTYAFDLPRLFQMASQAALARLGIPLPEVRERAIENLRSRLPQIGYKEHGPIWRILAGDNLEACTLLAGPFWDQIAPQMKGELVAAAPSRDVVLFCDSQSTEGMTLLRELASQVRASETTHALSERLLVWRDHAWAEWTA